MFPVSGSRENKFLYKNTKYLVKRRQRKFNTHSGTCGEFFFFFFFIKHIHFKKCEMSIRFVYFFHFIIIWKKVDQKLKGKALKF